MPDVLQQVRDLQYEDEAQATALLLAFMRENLPYSVVDIVLRPSAVSLNSFNGFMTVEGSKRYFFKSHTETDTVIDEYYNAEMLANAGYNVIQPVYRSEEPGKQMLIYEVITDPSVFEVTWEIENSNTSQIDELTQAQNTSDDTLFQHYKHTLTWQNAVEASKSPIHQLFYHRLAHGRLNRFYGTGNGDDQTQIRLPNGIHLLRDVRHAHWVINGQRYDETLNQLIDKAINLLNPAQDGPAIIGHGDAHNGNVFLRQQADGPTLLYFDPAFAGRHHPLLDIVKPLFHNVFAMWMYYPQEKKEKLRISLDTTQENWVVEHDYALHPIRHMFLQSKVERVLIPTLHMLKSQNWLQSNWRDFIKAALMCCPLLTMNLADNDRFPPEISLLGLVMAVEMSAESRGQRSLIDQTLDGVAATLT